MSSRDLYQAGLSQSQSIPAGHFEDEIYNDIISVSVALVATPAAAAGSRQIWRHNQQFRWWYIFSPSSPIMVQYYISIGFDDISCC